MAKIIVTVDFFHKDWHLDSGELWLFVRPIVSSGSTESLQFDQLEEWIQNNDKGRLFEYELARCDDRNDFDDSDVKQKYVHVNFCSDTNLLVEIERENQTSIKLKNNRCEGIHITNPSAFRMLNRPDPTLPQSNAEPTPVEIGCLPFARGYNESICDAYKNGQNGKLVPIADLASWLDMGLSGGTRMWIDGNVSDRETWGEQLMWVPPQSGDNPERGNSTNLHCLNGLSFRLGTKNNIDELKSITGLKISLEDKIGEFSVLDLGGTSDTKMFLKNYFSALGHLDQEKPKVHWDHEVQQNIYLVDIPQALACSRTQVGTRAWFKLSQPGDGDTNNKLRSSDRAAESLRRLTVRYKEPDKNRVLENVPKVLTWRLWSSYPASLVLYRKFPYSKGGSALLQLVTTPESAGLWEELEKSPELLLLGANDAEIPNLQKVGMYALPWDGDPEQSSFRTLLFFHPAGEVPPPLGPVRALIQKNDEDSLITTAQKEVKGAIGVNGVIEWEWRRPEKWTPSINRFERLSLETSGIDAKTLVPVLYFDDDVQFRPASTASHFEGLLEVIYQRPTSDSGDGCNVTPEDNILDDLINFNALNIYKNWKNGLEYVNPNKETYPIGSDSNQGMIKQVYWFGGSEMIEPSKPACLRTFYGDLYAKIGKQRELTFDLEHTYGLRLVPDGDSRVDTKTPFDWPPVMPCGIQFKDHPEDPKEPARTFLSVHYVGGEDGKAEIAKLIFDLEILCPEYLANHPSEANNKAHQLAWQAVAELRYAEKIVIEATGLRFDFNKALEGRAQGISGGMQDVKQGTWGQLQYAVQELCQKLLNGEHVTDGTIRQVLTGPSDEEKWFKICHVMEFQLCIRRPEATIPDCPTAGGLVAPTVESCAEGILFRATDHGMAEPNYIDWRKSILEAKSSISPSHLSDETRRFRELLGRSGEWFVPEGKAEPDEGQVVPSIIPFGFRPLAEYGQLGHESDAALRRYLNLLQIVLDCALPAWIRKDRSEWNEHFKVLASIAKPVTGLLEKLAAELILPLPDPHDGDLEQEIKQTLDALLDAKNELHINVYKNLTGRLVKQPTLFGSSKAFLFTQLRSDQEKLPRDLYSLIMQNKINHAETDEHLYTYADSIQFSQTEKILTFIQALNDLIYDNEFEVKKFTLENFEDKFDEESGRRRPCGSIPIADNILFLPSGRLDVNRTQDGPPKVFLASRSPVKAPVIVWSGYIEKCQEVGWEESIQQMTLSNSELRSGRLSPSEGHEQEVLDTVGFTRQGTPSSQVDDYIASFIYEIHGDEEVAGQCWANAFQNDSIRVYLESVSLDGPGSLRKPETNVPDPILTLFRNLLDKPLASLTDPLTDYFRNPNVNVLKFVTENLVKQAETITPPEASPNARIHLCLPADHDDCTDFRVNVRDTDIRLVEVLVFRPRGKLDETNKLFYLLVNLELSVWQRHRFKLVHTRNVEPDCSESDDREKRRRFAKEFGNFREQESPSGYVSWSSEKVISEPESTIDARKMTTTNLINELLVKSTPGGLPNESSSEWDKHRLVVSVFHEQKEFIQIATADNPDGEQNTNVSYAKFLLQREIALNDFDTEYVWFQEPYLDFSVTFQWFTATNRCFLALNRKHVTISKPL